ncbi:globin-like protein, partial [Baffinella frigidus]
QVLDSWAIVAEDLEVYGVQFFLKLFEIAPQALKLFSFRYVDDLQNSPGLKKHGVMVLEVVGEVVAGINTIEKLTPMLVELAVKHAEFNVVSEHFPVVGQALLATLQRGLGYGWTPDVEAAWTAVSALSFSLS